MTDRNFLRILVLCSALTSLRPALGADSFDVLAKQFAEQTRPTMQKHCLGCHSTKKQEGDLDLERFATLDSIRKEPEIWRHALEQIQAGEMPPKNKPRPSANEQVAITGWIQSYLRAEALANAGDPGPVLLRRLSNVEYDNTIRDLTGIDLKPTREFPADGAAGEGFTNVGDALVMSPALLEKYMEAAKGIATHLVMLPDGTKFSKNNSQADWTNELLDEIRRIYRLRTDPEGHTRVLLQGLEWDTNAGGRIPISQYLNATILLRESGKSDSKAIAEIAAKEKLSAKYIEILWEQLTQPTDSPILNRLQSQWKRTTAENIKPLAIEIQNWQKAVTKFGSVGHFKPWLGTQDPVATRVNLSEPLLKSPNGDAISLELSALRIGSQAEEIRLAWINPRLEKPGSAPIPLLSLKDSVALLNQKRLELKRSGAYLNAIETIRDTAGKPDFKAIAAKYNLDQAVLSAFADVAGLGHLAGPLNADLMLGRMENGGGYAFVKGWGSPQTPNVFANSSDQTVRVPGLMKPKSIAVHPSPSQSVAVVWQSPISGLVDIKAIVNDAHGDCGNGVTWSLEMRRGTTHQVLAAGVADTSKPNVIPPIPQIRVTEGSTIALVIGPKNGEHGCDLTEVNLDIREGSGQKRAWSLSGDVTPDIHAGNPHADSLGNPKVWAFTLEAASAKVADTLAVVPRGSQLDQWINEPDAAKRRELAETIQALFTSNTAPAEKSPDSELKSRLMSLQGPIFSKLNFATLAAGAEKQKQTDIEMKMGESRIFQIPAEWAEGRTLVSDAAPLQSWPNGVGAQIQAVQNASGGGLEFLPTRPVLIGASANETWKSALNSFRSVFPAAVCYPQIVPVDEVVTVALYHREDDNLSRLMLTSREKAYLDNLWEQLWFVSQEPLKVEVGYKQFMEYVTQDGDVRLFEPLRKPIKERANKFRAQLRESETRQWESVLKVADRAYRRPLRPEEKAGLKELYGKLREQSVPHDESLRLVLTRVLMSSAFMYRLEPSPDQSRMNPLNDWELASRLSYFLWSSMPDDELRAVADKGELHQSEALRKQALRMLADPKVRALSTEFACQWLHLKDFNTHNEKSEKIFPEFAELRGPMYEEIVLFFVDLFQNNRPVVNIIDSDQTFTNPQLAKFYGMDSIKGDGWQATQGMKGAGRGGLLGFAALTAKQSGASRTSPILRGNWLLETLLGEKLPKPPKSVPQLPESELDTNGLTVRQITEKHRADAACAKCHDRIDPFGMALEAFDPIGRRRTADLAGRPVDTAVALKDGTRFTGIDGLREYRLRTKRSEFTRQFHRKLLGYALGRSVRVSDDPLIDELQTNMQSKPGAGVQDSILSVILSPQFRNHRGLKADLQAE